eukprot:3326432-Amphidinium_carterae.1
MDLVYQLVVFQPACAHAPEFCKVSDGQYHRPLRQSTLRSLELADCVQFFRCFFTVLVAGKLTTAETLLVPS